MLGKGDQRGTGRGRRGEWGREEGGDGVCTSHFPYHAPEPNAREGRQEG